MGMLAEYMAIDQATLESLFKLENGSALAHELFELEESEKYERYGIAKTWDAIHLILTGVSASEPIADDKLSEAIVGVHLFHYYQDGDDYIAAIDASELESIIAAMEQVDLEMMIRSFDFSNPKVKEIYPSGILDAPIEDLIKEFVTDFQGMIQFYKKALQNNLHIIVSIL